MGDHNDDIRSALDKLGLSEAEFSRCDAVESTNLARVAEERFVVGAPRVWWMGFSPPYQSRGYNGPAEWRTRLNEAIPDGTRKCWMISEPGSAATSPTVYVADACKVADVLGECRFFEYYLVDPNLDWIIADTDHNQIVVARPVAAKGVVAPR
jgi:hypothetical protein